MRFIANRTIFEPEKVWKTFRVKPRDLAGNDYEHVFFGHINNLYEKAAELGSFPSFVPNVLDTTGSL